MTPGNTYARKGCSLRAIPRDVRVARARETCRRLGAAELSRRGKLGGPSSNVERWGRLLEKWLGDMLPREALRDAWTHGYFAGYKAGRRGHANRHAARDS